MIIVYDSQYIYARHEEPFPVHVRKHERSSPPLRLQASDGDTLKICDHALRYSAISCRSSDYGGSSRHEKPGDGHLIDYYDQPSPLPTENSQDSKS